MAMLPPPLIPDANQWIAARQAGYEQGEALRRRNLLLEAGQLAAAPSVAAPAVAAASGAAGALGDRIRMAESGGRLDARNPNSSAYGPDQFISGTWLDVLKRNRPDIAAGKSDGELLAMRSNSELSGAMRDAYTRENQNALRGAGLPVTDGTSYLAHFAGAGGARGVLSANPATPVNQILRPNAVRANPFLQNMTAGDLRAWADKRAGGSAQPTAQPAADPNAGLRNASNALLRGGELQAGLGIQNTLYERSEKERAQAEARQKEGRAIVGEMALKADTPEKWARLVETARRGGLDVTGLEDFSMRDMVIARAGKSMDYMSAGKRVFNKTTGEYVPVDPNAPTDVSDADFSKNPVYGVDAQGNTVILQLNDQGGAGLTKLPEGVRVGKDPIRIDAGTEVILLDPVTRQAIGRVPKDVAGESAQREAGKGRGEAQANLPTVRSNARSIKDMINNVLNDPYLPRMTGPMQGRLPNISGSSNRVQSKVDQLQGQAFLQAFNSIRGGGQITEAEGAKATVSLSRLQNMNVNDPEYPQALRDFMAEVDRLVALAEEKAGAPPSAAPPPPADTGGFKVLRVR